MNGVTRRVNVLVSRHQVVSMGQSGDQPKSVAEKVGEPPHRRTKWSPLAEWQVESVNLSEFAGQKNAGQALGASGCDRHRECEAQDNPAPLGSEGAAASSRADGVASREKAD